MRTIPQIHDDAVAIRDQLRVIANTKAERLQAFKLQLDTEFGEEVRVKNSILNDLTREAEAVRSAAVSHPLEGKRVTRTVRVGRWGSGKPRVENGIVVCIRTHDDRPAIDYSSNRSRPDIGETIIQRLSAKGEKLTKWHRLMFDGTLPADWSIVEG